MLRGQNESRSCHALADRAASPIASHFRVVLRAPPVRVLLGPYVLSVFCKRDPLGLRGRPAGPARKPTQLCQVRMGRAPAHCAYLRRPFAVLEAVRALGPCSTVRSILHARRVSEPRFGARNNLNAIDGGEKVGRSCPKIVGLACDTFM